MEGNVFVHKETSWITNSLVLAEILRGTDVKEAGKTWRRHISLIGGGRERAAKVYLLALLKAVLESTGEQMRQDGQQSAASAQLSRQAPQHDVEYNLNGASVIQKEFTNHDQKMWSG